MADLATLKIAVDSREVKKAQEDLRRLGFAATEVEGSTNKLTGAFGGLKGLFASLGLGLAAREFVLMADSVKMVEARVKSVTPATENLAAIQKQLVEISKSNMTTLEGTANLYAKLSRPLRALGGDTQAALSVTRAFGQALRIGGANTQEAAAAMQQFAQAMASGVLRGDEFNSIAEASPRILQAIAQGSGLAEGALRSLAAEGKLTAGVVGGALLKQMVALEAESMRLPVTVGGAFTNFKTDLALVAGDIDKNVGLTNALVSAFGVLASIVRVVGTAAANGIGTLTQFLQENKTIVIGVTAAVATLGGAMLGLAAAARVATAVTALTAALGAMMQAITVARIGFAAMAMTMGTLPAIFAAVRMAAISLYASMGPLGIAIAAVGAGLAYLATKRALASDAMTGAANSTANFNKELKSLNARIEAFKSGDGVKIKGVEQAEQMQQYADALREAGANEKQITTLVGKRTELQQLEIKQAEQIEKTGAQQAAAAAAKAKAEAAAGKARQEAEQRAKQAAQMRQNVLDQITDTEDQIALILQKQVTAEEARLMIQLRRQGATEAEIEKILALNAQLALLSQKAELPEWLTGDKPLEITGDPVGRLMDDLDRAQKSADAFLNTMVNIDIDGVFGNTGKAFASLINSFDQLIERQDAFNDAMERNKNNPLKMAELQNKQMRLQINNYGNLVGAAKGFFKENTKGYKVMESAEKAFRAIELALAIKTTATKLGLIGAQTAAKVASDGTMAASDTSRSLVEMANSAKTSVVKGVEAVVNAIRSMPFPLNLVAGAATAAAVASLGVAISGSFSGGGTRSQTNTGTGTVFGDNKAQSESITRSIERLAEVDTLTMRYSAQMAGSLRSIEANISGLANLVLRTTGITASGANVKTGTAGVGDPLKSVGNALSGIPVIGSILGGIAGALGSVVNALFGSKTSIIGQGISGGAQSLGGIMAGGFDAQYYTDVQKKKKFFGITSSTSYSTQFAEADAEVERQFGLIFQGFYDAIKTAAIPLGAGLTEVEQRLNEFVVNIGRIDLRGLTGDEINERLTAIFGAAADQIAQAAIPGLERFQQVGEGYFETVVRVASGVEQAASLLNKLGVQAIAYSDIINQQGDVTAEIIRQSVTLNDASIGVAGGFAEIINNASGTGEQLFDLVVMLRDMQSALVATGKAAETLTTYMIDGAGGAEALTQGLGFYFDNFLTTAEQNAVYVERLTAQFGRLGLSMPTSVEQFRKLVDGIDTTTTEGQKLYGAVIALAPAFGDYLDTLEEATTAQEEQAQVIDLTNERRRLEIALMEAQGLSSEALAARRAMELEAMDESLRGLQQQVWAAQDAAEAQKKLTEEQAALQKATEDRLAAEQRAAEQAAEAAAQLARKRTELEATLAGLQGRATDELRMRRELELESIDETLRGLQQQIYAQEDLNAAAQAAAESQRAATEALEEAAKKAAELARSRAEMEAELLDLQGNKAEALAIRRQLELDAMDESLRGLQQQINTQKDLNEIAETQRIASEAAAEAAAEAAKETERLANEAADRQIELAKQRTSLEIELLDAQGKATEAVAARRAIELAAMDESLRPLQNLIWSYQDAAVAQEAAAKAAEDVARSAEEAAAAQRKLADERLSLEIELMRALGNETGALAAERARELSQMDESLRGLQEQVWAAQDAKKAQDALTQTQRDAASAFAEAQRNAAQAVEQARNDLSGAYEREANAIKAVRDRFAGFAASLREFRDSLIKDNGGGGYTQELARFSAVAREAALGNADAMGALPEAGRNFLEAARANAGSARDYQRDVARVMQAVDAAIGTADRTVAVQDMQLSALTSSVEQLIDLNTNVLGVEEAIKNLNDALTAEAALTAGATTASGQPVADVFADTAAGIDTAAETLAGANQTLSEEVKGLREELKAAMFQIAKNTGKTYDQLQRWDGDGLPETRNVAA